MPKSRKNRKYYGGAATSIPGAGFGLYGGGANSPYDKGPLGERVVPGAPDHAAPPSHIYDPPGPSPPPPHLDKPQLDKSQLEPQLHDKQFDHLTGGRRSKRAGTIGQDLSQVSQVLTQNAKNIGANISHGAEWIGYTGKSVASKAFNKTKSLGRQGWSKFKGLGDRAISGLDTAGNRIGTTASHTFTSIENKLGGRKSRRRTRRTHRKGTKKGMRRKTARRAYKH